MMSNQITVNFIIFFKPNKALDMKFPIRTIFCAMLVASIACSVNIAFAENYEFRASPHISLNRVYRVDKVTGEMGACQYGLVDNSVGATLCYTSGEGAQAQSPSEYGLISSSHQQESGIFRVNKKTGEMSVCYVLNDEKVVCTPQTKDTQTIAVPAPLTSVKPPETPAKPVK